MKIKLVYIVALMGLAIISSCSKDDNGEIEKFSEKTVEENKAIVEESAISMVNTMEDMKDLETMDVAVNLGNILDTSDPFKSATTQRSKLNMVIHAIAGIKTGENDLNTLFKALKTSGELEEDPETLQDIWDELVGTYSWNPSIEDWDFVAGGDKAIFEFPSSETSTTNDAVFTVYNYNSVIITPNPLDEEYEGDFPTSLNADLKVGTTELITFVFTAQYNTDGIPSMVATDLTIETFAFEIDITNTDTKVSANYKFTQNGEIVMEIGGTANGDFTQENIDNNTVTKTDTWTWWDYQYNEQTGQWDYVEVTEVDEWEEVEFEEVLRSASAHFQLFNIQINGDIDVKGLVDKMNVIYPDDEPEDFDWDAADEAAVVEINRYLDLRAINVTANEKIAEVEAYVVYEEDEWDEWTYIDFRLVFGDGSRIDLETYFEEGFDDFIAEVNTMIDELNSDYDWDIEPIEYDK